MANRTLAGAAERKAKAPADAKGKKAAAPAQ
jgi:hypothetical protein